MSHPRYRVIETSQSYGADACYVQDTEASSRRLFHVPERMSWVDASYLAQWLNDRAKGYARVIRFDPKYSEQHGISVLAETLQMQAHSHQNWRNHGALKSPKRMYK